MAIGRYNKIFWERKEKKISDTSKVGRSMKYDELDLEVADKLADRKDVN